jgi:LEA14-like dessication related protein
MSIARLIGGLLILVVASCANPKDLVYQDVKNFSVKKISLNPEVGMDVQFYNPNKYGMTLKDADINLYINNTLVGHAVMDEKFNVPAADTFLLMSNKEVTVKLQGSVKAGKGVLVRIPISYEGKKKLNVF